MSGVRPTSSLLQLIWLASPALPVGGFSYSEGLEALIEKAPGATESEVAEWLVDQMYLAQARGDWPVVAQAIAAWRAEDAARIQALNDWVLQTRESSEMRLQTEQMGRSLTDWLRNLHAADSRRRAAIDQLAALPPTYLVAFALAVAHSDADVRDALLAFGFGWAENMVQAALKAVPLGQNAGQRVLAHLAAELPAAVDHALGVTDDTRQAFTPMLAIRSAQHEVQYSRLFRS
jgi:urease accessory protein